MRIFSFEPALLFEVISVVRRDVEPPALVEHVERQAGHRRGYRDRHRTGFRATRADYISFILGEGDNRQAGQLEFPLDRVFSSLRQPVVPKNRLDLLPALGAAPIEHDDMTLR